MQKFLCLDKRFVANYASCPFSSAKIFAKINHCYLQQYKISYLFSVLR